MCQLVNFGECDWSLWLAELQNLKPKRNTLYHCCGINIRSTIQTLSEGCGYRPIWVWSRSICVEYNFAFLVAGVNCDRLTTSRLFQPNVLTARHVLTSSSSFFHTCSEAILCSMLLSTNEKKDHLADYSPELRLQYCICSSFHFCILNNTKHTTIDIEYYLHSRQVNLSQPICT